MYRYLLIFIIVSTFAEAQDVPITQGWKFKTGDQPEWTAADFNDKDWQNIEVGKPWEEQGHPGYDGFAWYRLHVVIPSSIRKKSFLKEKLRFDLGKIDDGDEVYLNGSPIGKNAGNFGDIKTGPYDQQRSYTISLNDRRINWDKENVIAVRVWDGGGDGGLYEGVYGISVVDLPDYILINNSDNDFVFKPGNRVSKKIILQSISDQYDFTGKLRIQVIDPQTGNVLFKETIGADFARNRPFEYTYTASVPAEKYVRATYDFEEERTKKIVSEAELIPYLLTPAPKPSLKINGPSVFGTRSNAPFQYKIPATGDRPISFEATGLPAGLTLNKETGIITGTLLQKGKYKVKLTVKNKLGSASKDFTILCGDKIGLTPALGWNSWNCWGLSVNDQKVRTSAKAMADKLADHGWTYINIDDGWQDKRNDQGEMIPNSKFPDMKSLADYVHSLGLKIGVYTSPGPQTCGGYAGSYQHELQDAKTYANWGIDYLKYDWCSYGQIAPPKPSLEDYKKPYSVMRDALNQVNRDILFSLCQYGMGDVWNWGGELGGNSWRTTGDIVDTWGSLFNIGFGQEKAAPHTRPGEFNDPDMLIVGKLGWGPRLHHSRLSPDEQYTHISLWSLLSAPLLIGCDMSALDEFTLNLLTNDEVLAINQDAAAKPAMKIFEGDHEQVWSKELENGSHAVGIFNLADYPVQPTISFADLKWPDQMKLRDVWRQKDLGVQRNAYQFSIPAHGVVLLNAAVVR